MHIIDAFGGEKLPVSFEIFPPKGDLPVEEAREVIGGLAPLSPSFVSVTYSAGGRAIPRARSTWRKWRKTNMA